MIKATHIATKLILLIAITLLLALTRYASAQNTSAQPFVDSWHLYRVPMGNTGHSYTWHLFDNLADAQANTNVDYTLTGAETWANTVVTAGNADIEIKFIDANFNGGQTWYLVYSEWDNTAGTGNCVARRSTQIDIIDNNFYLTLAADGEICNPLAGSVLNWDNIDGLGLGHSGTSTNMPTYVDFTIQMNKAANFVLNTWVFRGTITRLDLNYLLVSVRTTTGVLTGTSAGGGSFTITDNGNGTFDVVVNTPTDASVLNDYIVVRANITGLVHEGERVQLDVSGGEAHSGSVNYGVVTTDNLLLPSAPGDRQQLQTIFPLPATPNITLVN